jgi:vancomycin resistance protein YoaR
VHLDSAANPSLDDPADAADPADPAHPADPPHADQPGWPGWAGWPGILPSDRRTAIVLGGGLLLLLAVLMAMAYALAGSGVPFGTRVLGVEIGGLAPDAAAQKLENGLGHRVDEPIPLVLDGQSAALDPTVAGLRLDTRATVERASRRSPNPLMLFYQLLGPNDVDPVINVDRRKLDSAIDRLAKKLDQPVREGGVLFRDGRAVAVEPRAGRRLDRVAAVARVRSAYLVAGEPLTLGSSPVEPMVTAAEVDRAMTEFAEPALSGPVRLNVDDQTIDVSTQALAGALSMQADLAGRLQPRLSAEKLRESLATDLDRVEREPRDATFRIVNGRPHVVPAVDGVRVKADVLRDAVLAALPRGASRTATVATTPTKAELTTEEAGDLGITEKLSTFTQHFPYAAYRVRNIGTAARYIDGTVLAPGDVFSMNGTVKERTPENGYTTGTVISEGRFREDLGGGVSTITTATWTAAFYAGLERLEQRAHSFYISRYAPGLEATVSWGALDLRFRNDSPTGVLITAAAGNDQVTITMWGTKRYDVKAEFGPRTNLRPFETVYDSRPGCVEQTGVAGFDITVTRVFQRQGQVVKREPMKTSYNAADQIYCQAPSQPKPSDPVNRQQMYQ